MSLPGPQTLSKTRDSPTLQVCLAICTLMGPWVAMWHARVGVTAPA